MSPHSVARFLPANALDIDLVVFDEASQIRVAEAISAMGRAKAAVVVGDSQQMPPSNLMTTNATDDDTPAARRDPVRHGERAVGGGRVQPAAAVAVMALPQPARVANRVLQPPVLRRPAGELPAPARDAERPSA